MLPLWASYVIDLIATTLNKWLAALRGEETLRQEGRHEAELKQAQAGQAATERMAQEAAKPLDEDEAIARLERGEG